MASPESPTAPAVRTEVEFERLWLDDTSWVDVARGWISSADRLFDTLVETVPWRQSRLFRYDHYVEEPRLGAMWSLGRPPPDPVIVEAQRSLQHRYHVRFDGCAFAYYRDGNDGQAFHRDRSMRWLDDTVIGVLSLGTQRPWLLRPRANRERHELDRKGATHDFTPASGDLLVMGGRCQADWEHSVPQLRDRALGGRVSLQWRWTSHRGRPQVGGNYGDPRYYSK